MKRIFIYILLCGSSYLFLSCLELNHDNIEGVSDYEPFLALPIGESVLYFEDSSSLPSELWHGNNPLHIYYIDTISVSLSDLFFEVNDVLFLSMHSYITNAFPFVAEGSLYFQTIDSVIVLLTPEPVLLQAATIDTDGALLDSTTLIYDIEVEFSSMIALFDVSQIYIETKLHDVVLTPDFIQHLNDYRVNSDIGFRIHLSLQGDD